MTCFLITSDCASAVAASFTAAFGIDASSEVVILSATSVSCTWSFADSPCVTMYAPAPMNTNPNTTAASHMNRLIVASGAISLPPFPCLSLFAPGSSFASKLTGLYPPSHAAFGPHSHAFRSPCAYAFWPPSVGPLFTGRCAANRRRSLDTDASPPLYSRRSNSAALGGGRHPRALPLVHRGRPRPPPRCRRWLPPERPAG